MNYYTNVQTIFKGKIYLLKIQKISLKFINNYNEWIYNRSNKNKINNLGSWQPTNYNNSSIIVIVIYLDLDLLLTIKMKKIMGIIIIK
jgi:hypothetical protein